MNFSFFGKYFKYTFASLIAVELISLLSFIYSPLHQVAFFVIIFITALLSFKKLEYGLYLILAELFIGGKGHLFSLEIGEVSLSIRIGLFITVLLIWLLSQMANGKWQILPSSYKLTVKGYYALFVFITIGLINGYFNNDLKNLFLDFNAWIFFGLIFIFLATIKSTIQVKNIIQILGGATVYLSLKTIGSLIFFSHYITGIGGVFYGWIRNSGVGEITYISGTIFRIFFQSQLYVMIGFLISLVMIISIQKIKTKKSLYLLGYAYITSLAIVISQSRSYWVGLGAALIIFILFGWWKFNFRIKKTFLAITILIIMFTSQLLVVNLLTGNFDGNIAGDRFKNLQSEPAGLSRLNQLKPLGDAILQQLIFGYGFGKTLTYQSNDPRIMAENPDGIYTTFAFEWGYLDIWLKIGLLGLLAYFGLIGTIIYTGIINPSYTKTSAGKQESEIKNLKIGLFLGLVAVLATNMFSPYLNHPLGIGYILLISAIYNVE